MHDSSVKSAASIREAIRALAPEWQVEQIERFDYLSGGYSNDNYHFAYQGEEFVIRLPARTRSFIDRELERRFYAEQQDRLPMPELIALDVTSGNLLTRFVAGELLADAPPPLAAIASYLRSLHGALPATGRRYDPFALSREYLAAGDAPIPLRKLADTHWQPEPVVACHNDLNPWNVILNAPDRWVTLDWEWVGLNDPLFDLVTLHQGLGLADDSLQPLIDLWQPDSIDQGRLERCLMAFWLREFAWAWAERRQGNTRQEIEAQIDLSREKLAALLS